MLKEMMTTVMQTTISQDYAHLKLPAVILAKVSAAKKLSDTYDITELEITNEDSGETYKAHYKAFYYEYCLMVIDRFGNLDESFPPIPGIRSRLAFETGTIVAISLVYGDIAPAIIGEVSL